MISLKQSLSEFDRLESLQKASMDCYRSAVEAAGQHVVETDENLTKAYREHLEALAQQVKAAGSADALKRTRVSLLGELEEYAGRGTRYLKTLREQLAVTSRALTEIVESVRQDDSSGEQKLQKNLNRLAQVAQHPEVAKLCPEMKIMIAEVADSVTELRKQSQLVVAQLREEVSSLRGALSSAQQAAGRDAISGVLNRAETLAQIRKGMDSRKGFCLVFVWIASAGNLQRTHGSQSLDEIVVRFCQRLREAVGPEVPIGRWSDEQFVAMVERPKPEAMWLSDNLAGQLRGPYILRKNDWSKEVTLRLKSGVVESSASTDEARLLRMVDRLLNALESVPD